MIQCPSCSAEQTDTSTYCSVCGAALDLESDATVSHQTRKFPPPEKRIPNSSDSSHHGRFLPGTKVAERYRIVSLLGRGGMGEVYRADDLKLGHTVALKFLPDVFAQQPDRLEYFHSEVRLTRQISHPNVCRVFDIGEVEGQHFLSMEYIDGEDLRILLRRIGRLPKDKGVQIAQQLCAGLAEAHEQGVLHRDLKPANIMLDGRGNVRITDFGLAKLADDVTRGEVAGTPAYMAPEQLLQGETTIQSDLYSLGLILYEMFTGEAVHKSGSVPEIIRSHEKSSPSHPSNLVDDMDPVVERVILRCLEKAPHQRPESARAVAAALPGGDPLAAALAAGETPSPEMVAAAGESGRLTLNVGIALLVATFVLLSMLPFLASWLDIYQLGDLRSNEPAVLRNDAVQWIQKLGHTAPAVDNASLFVGPREFRYRQSSSPLSPRITRLFGASSVWWVFPNNPPENAPGMITVKLNPGERFQSGNQLIEFKAVLNGDPQVKSEKATMPLDWSQYFQILGFEFEEYSPVALADRPKNWRPSLFVDDISVWQETRSEDSFVILGVRNDQLVYFRRIDKQSNALQSIPSGTPIGTLGIITIVAVVFSGILAVRNLQSGRSDVRGGLRFALYYFAVEIVLGVIVSHHPASWGDEIHFIANYLIYAQARALRIWLYYVGFEPYVRRLWPVVLISWSRVMSGRFHDPLVGRDVMIGCLFAVTFSVPSSLLADRVPNLDANLQASYGIGTILVVHQLGLISAFAKMAILLLCRVAMKKTWLTVISFALITTLVDTLRLDLDSDVIAFRLILEVMFAAGLAVIYIRFGLVSAIVAQCVYYLLVRVIHTADFGAWYAMAGNYALAAVVLISCFGFFSCTLAAKGHSATNP